MSKLCGLLALLALSVQTAFAGGLGVSLNYGTGGFGLELGKDISPTWDTRLAFHTSKMRDFTVKESSRYDEVSDARADLALLADWHPFENGLRASAGLGYYYADHKIVKSSTISEIVTTTTSDPFIEMVSQFYSIITLGLVKPTKSITTTTSSTWADFGTHTYNVKYRAIAPYVGIGYSSPVSQKDGFGLTIDVGAFYRGAPKVDTSFSCGTSNPAGTPTCLAYQNALSSENSIIQKRYSPWLPQVSLGINYNF